MMTNFAHILFYVHSALCMAYFIMMCKLSTEAVLGRGGRDSGPFSAMKIDNLYLVNDDRIINGIMYFILGMFLLYAEIYMYRIYSLSLVLTS